MSCTGEVETATFLLMLRMVYDVLHNTGVVGKEEQDV